MKYLIYCLPFIFLFVGACDQKKAQEESTTEVLYILSEQDECLDRGKLNCVKYKKSEDADSIYLYDGKIEGFTYLDGFEYVIKVDKKMVEKEGSEEKIEKWVLNETIKKQYDEDAYMVKEKIDAKYFRNARLKLDESTQNLPKLVPGSNLVFQFNRQAPQNERIADDELGEKVLIEINNRSGDFTINNAAQTIKAFYGKYCFCEYAGLAELIEFTLEATAVQDSYEVNITIPPQEMKLLEPGKSGEVVPLVREERNFSATFHRGSVMKMLEDNYSDEGKESVKLDGEWLVKSISGNLVSEYKNTSTKPKLDLKLGDMKYTGNDGCNTIRGAVAIDGNAIAFDKGISTKKSCETSLDEDFSEAFKNVNRWKVMNKELHLMDDKTTMLVLVKE